jgi:hypothetical protein
MNTSRTFPLMRRPLLAAAAVLALTTSAAPQTPSRPAAPPAAKPQIRLEAVAETKLLMEALMQANTRSLDRILREKPTELEGWTFARGQALLIAETANLLMLRPARGEGREPWLERSRDLREVATALARTLAARDYERSRIGLAALGNACTRCHQTFRVNIRVTPFTDGITRPALDNAKASP